MADGLNQARAMRVAELLNDFRSLQYHITTLQARPRPEEYYLEGYAWLRQAVADAQTVLSQDYTHDTQHPRGDVEVEKSLLKLIIIDSSVRRFQCQRAYMQAVICKRWIDSRNTVLRGRAADPTNAGQATQLQAVDVQLRSEMDMITDELVEQTLHERDEAEGKYLDDDPDLEDILELLELRGS